MSSTSAYAIVPSSGSGPGILVLHSWFGLTGGVKGLCDALADAGFVAVAPDLFDGKIAEDAAEGEKLLLDADPNLLVAGVKATADALRRMPATPDGRIGVLGMSMGASLGLWLSEREPDLVAAVVAFYGSQEIDFTRSQSAYQFHLADLDTIVDHDELALMEASMRLSELEVDVHRYPDVGHWFLEPGSPGYAPDEAEAAWARAVSFFDDHL